MGIDVELQWLDRLVDARIDFVCCRVVAAHPLLSVFDRPLGTSRKTRRPDNLQQWRSARHGRPAAPISAGSVDAAVKLTWCSRLRGRLVAG
jgi:hypothetical protein